MEGNYWGSTETTIRNNVKTYNRAKGWTKQVIFMYFYLLFIARSFSWISKEYCYGKVQRICFSNGYSWDIYMNSTILTTEAGISGIQTTICFISNFYHMQSCKFTHIKNTCDVDMAAGFTTVWGWGVDLDGPADGPATEIGLLGCVGRGYNWTTGDGIGVGVGELGSIFGAIGG